MRHKTDDMYALRARREAILRGLTAVEAPRIMLLTVIVIVLFDVAYALVGIRMTTGYYVSDVLQAGAFIIGALLIIQARIPLKFGPSIFMAATVVNTAVTTYQYTIAGSGAIGVILIMLTISSGVALQWAPWLTGTAMSLVISGWVLLRHGGDEGASWFITILTAATMAATVLYGRSESAWELAAAQEKIGLLATRDPLTSLLNRRGLRDQAQALRERAARAGSAIFVVFVDVTGLKTVNDAFGHEWGDVVLQRTADTLTAHAADVHLVCRWGGDEFVILGIGDVPVALATAEQLHHATQQSGLDGKWDAKFWLGSASCSAEDFDLDMLIGRADRHLYSRRSQ